MMEARSCKDCTHLRIKLSTEKNGKVYRERDGNDNLADSNIIYPSIENPHAVSCELDLIEGFDGGGRKEFTIRSMNETKKSWIKAATICAEFDGEDDA